MRKEDWPARWEQRHQTIYYRTKDAERKLHGWPRRIRLGAEENEAYRTYYKLIAKGIITPRTIGDAMNIYLAGDRFAGLAEKTQSEYRKSVDRLRPVFGKLAPSEWIPAWGYQYLDLNPKVQGNRDLSVFSQVMQVCVRAGVIERNLVKEVEKNREESRDRYIRDDEIEAFLKHCTSKLRAWVELKMLTGLRQGQMRQLRLSDWRDGELWVDGNKGGRKTVYRGPGLQAAVNEAIASHHGEKPKSIWLLCNKKGNQYTADGFRTNWQKAMAKYVEKGGERFTEHDIRAKVASDSEDVVVAQARLGHQSASTTNKVYRRGPAQVDVLHKETGHDD